MTRAQANETLFSACKAGDIGLVRLLLEKGADICAHDEGGRTPLHLACLYGRTATVRLLLEKGANVNAKNMAGRTPLHNACFQCDPAVIRLLLDHGVDDTITDCEGAAPLDLVLRLPIDDPARGEILDLFRERAPDLVMEAYCTSGPDLGGI